MPKIYCMHCNKYVGEISKAKLAKGLKHICIDCSLWVGIAVAQYKKSGAYSIFETLMKTTGRE